MRWILEPGATHFLNRWSFKMLSEKASLRYEFQITEISVRRVELLIYSGSVLRVCLLFTSVDRAQLMAETVRIMIEEWEEEKGTIF